MKIPKWLLPKKQQIKDFKVLFKAFIKSVFITGMGILAIKYGADPVFGLAIAGFLHGFIKIIDPTDKSIGINKE